MRAVPNEIELFNSSSQSSQVKAVKVMILCPAPRNFAYGRTDLM